MSSALNKKWNLLEPDPAGVENLSRELNLPSPIANLLWNRDVKDAENARYFLEADLANLHDPFLMTGMRTAVDRIVKAIEEKEKITLFCDYDVDGVTSAAFMIHFFRELGVAVDYYLPDRKLEGYGLNAEAVKKIKAKGSALIITADCGITAVGEVRLANELGLDVIVSDHHQVGEEGLPQAVAVLNPHRSDCEYPFKFLSGVGIVFKLATAIRNALHRAGWEKERLPNLKRHLDLFALGTIADVAPLTDENHVLTAHGLREMTVTTKPGLAALKSVADLNGKVNARSVGFVLGPRLNAAGRLGKADTGLHLLTAANIKEAMPMARRLEEVNRERREIQNWTQEEAEYLISREVDLERDRVIVLASDNFHAGVIGIVASRLVEKYFRPTVLIALEESLGKGSARSIPAFNMFKAFNECSAHLAQFGGHAYAAGLSIDASRVEPFRRAINEVGHRILNDGDLVPVLDIDVPLEFENIHLDMFRQIQKMEPFGAGNPVPVFVSRQARIRGVRFIGKEKNHVRFVAVQGKSRMDAVAFNMREQFADSDIEGVPVDLAYELQLNEWNGREKLELIVLDFRKSRE